MKAFKAFCRQQLAHIEELDFLWDRLWEPPIGTLQFLVEQVRYKAAKLGLAGLVEKAPDDAGLNAARVYLAAALAECKQSSPNDLLTVTEVARRLKVNRDKVLGWINAGKLRTPNTSNGRLPRYGINRADLDAFLARRTKTSTPPTKAPTPSGGRDAVLPGNVTTPGYAYLHPPYPDQGTSRPLIVLRPLSAVPWMLCTPGVATPANGVVEGPLRQFPNVEAAS